jgi:hypothetical protein
VKVSANLSDVSLAQFYLFRFLTFDCGMVSYYGLDLQLLQQLIAMGQ